MEGGPIMGAPWAIEKKEIARGSRHALLVQASTGRTGRKACPEASNVCVFLLLCFRFFFFGYPQ
jgi:hypothetical protein